MSGTKESFRLRVEYERKALEKLELRVVVLQDRAARRRESLRKMEAHLKDWETRGERYGNRNA